MKYCNVDYVIYEHVKGFPEHLDKPNVEMQLTCEEQNMVYEDAVRFCDYINKIQPKDKFDREHHYYAWR